MTRAVLPSAYRVVYICDGGCGEIICEVPCRPDDDTEAKLRDHLIHCPEGRAAIRAALGEKEEP